jgi:mRNA interferase MazF
LRRGDIYTAATGSGYGSKPRPVLVIQSDAYPTGKRLVALIGSPFENAFPVRVSIEPDATNNLRWTSTVMIDVLQAVRAHQFGSLVGRLRDEDMRRVDEALLQVLGLGLPG